MPRARKTVTDYRASVVAVPPIALKSPTSSSFATSKAAASEACSSAARQFLQIRSRPLRLGARHLDAAAEPGTHVIASIGPDFGKLSDQAPLVERSPIRNVERLRARLGGIQALHDAVTAADVAPMGPQLPMISSVPAAAMEKVKEVVNRQKEADRSAGEAALAGSE